MSIQTQKLIIPFISTKSFRFILLFFVACFFYFWLRIHPSLYYQCQVPAFLWDRTFFQQFLVFPGGLMEYLSTLLSQFYYYPVIGALLLTLYLFILYLLSSFFISHFLPQVRSAALALFPTILLLMIFSQYEHRLAGTLALFSSLLLFTVFIKLNPKRSLFRFLLFFVLSMLLYYISAGYLLLFALLCFLYEIFERRTVIAVIYVFTILFIPYAAQQWIYILSLKNAYLYLIFPNYRYQPPSVPYFLPAFYPIVLLIGRMKTYRYPPFLQQEKRRKQLALLFFALFTLIAVFVSFDSSMYTVLQVDEYARNKEWTKLLEFVKKHPSDDILVVFQTNRALYHTNRLATEMFGFQQDIGSHGLYLPPEMRRFFSIQVSDLYWDLGFLNEAEHWVLEDHTNFNYGPWHLQRLALISILKGNESLAHMCLETLSKTILYRRWAEHYRPYVGNPALVASDSSLAHLKVNSMDNDFIISTKYPGQDVEMIMLQESANKMAFEYTMADYLLTFRLGALILNLYRLDEFDRLDIPRHYQEAALIYLSTSEAKNVNLYGRTINVKTVQEFTDFMHILQRHKNNALAARKELFIKYGDTYWYYSLYNNPAMQNAVLSIAGEE